MGEQTLHLVGSALERAGLEIAAERRAALVSYLELLCTWGQQINLTSRPEPAFIAERLLPDALVLLSALRSERSLLDVGSGAGIPGLVLALLRPELQVQLVEPSHKRCAFLRTAAHRLRLQVTIVEGRLEDVAHSLRSPDLACSRATWAPAAWLERAVPLVRPGAEIVAFLARAAQLEELPRALPLRLREEVSYQLADGTPRLLRFYQRLEARPAPSP